MLPRWRDSIASHIEGRAAQIGFQLMHLTRTYPGNWNLCDPNAIVDSNELPASLVRTRQRGDTNFAPLMTAALDSQAPQRSTGTVNSADRNGALRPSSARTLTLRPISETPHRRM